MILTRNSITIGIILEGKLPPDQRVPFTPKQVKEIQKIYPHVNVCVQRSPIRSFGDEEYEKAGIQVVSDIGDCDILMGIKEVPISDLIPGKTYLFFSHTTKKQPYNRMLLKSIVDKKIRLIDYESLSSPSGYRLAGFGRYAGIVGAYNGLIAYGMRHGLYSLCRANTCSDLDTLKKHLQKIILPPIKIVLTGNGRVAKGALEILDLIPGIKQVTPKELLNDTFTVPVYTQLRDKDYLSHKKSGGFDKNEYRNTPEDYVSAFTPFTRVADLLIAGTYWPPKAPVLFTREDTQSLDFSINVIADITCDIEGSIPSTKRPSTIAEPFYDYDPIANTVKKPFSSSNHITVMAVDNLPCELPHLASEDFGRNLIDKVLPSLLTTDEESIIEKATITMNGKLTEHFVYLSNFLARETKSVNIPH